MRPVAPYLAASRPSLELLDRLPAANAHVTYRRIEQQSGKPKATLLRLVNELVGAFLLAKVRRDWYATPTQAAQAILLTEPSPYHRSLLLYDDVFPTVGLASWAFACVPIRKALAFELPQAIPVLKLDVDLLDETAGSEEAREKTWFPDTLRFTYDDSEVVAATVTFPSAAEPTAAMVQRQVRCLPPPRGLSLLASTSDPRIVSAVRTAAKRLGVPIRDVLAEARRYEPRRRPVRGMRPSTVVYPRWLQDIADTAGEVHTKAYLRREPPEGGPPP